MCTVEQVKQTITTNGNFESAIGHGDLAHILSDLLDVEIPVNRTTVNIDRGDLVVVAQYVGPRLEEGTTSLPEGAEIRFFELTVV